MVNWIRDFCSNKGGTAPAGFFKIETTPKLASPPVDPAPPWTGNSLTRTQSFEWPFRYLYDYLGMLDVLKGSDIDSCRRIKSKSFREMIVWHVIELCGKNLGTRSVWDWNLSRLKTLSEKSIPRLGLHLSCKSFVLICMCGNFRYVQYLNSALQHAYLILAKIGRVQMVTFLKPCFPY